MLAALAAQWRLLLARGLLGLIVGFLVLVWPGMSFDVLVVLFGSYTVLNGLVVFTIALSGRPAPGFTGLFVAGLVGMTIGILILLYPIAAMVLVGMIAAWAVVTGLAALTTAAALRTELSGDWPLPLEGVLALMLGAFVLLQPAAGVAALRWITGLYAVLAGASQLGLALRMRQLAQEIGA